MLYIREGYLLILVLLAGVDDKLHSRKMIFLPPGQS